MSVPGLNPRRMLRLMGAAVRRCELQLGGLTILTEAATGAWAVTPVLAGMAGAASVLAVARDSRYGPACCARAWTASLAEQAGVSVEFLAEKTPQALRAADIVTNSGHLRPLDAAAIAAMRPGAAIPLMYEAWEFRAGDVDLAACRARDISVAGTNEAHPAVAVLPYLGVMAVKFLLDAGVAVRGSRVAVLCDNAFRPHLLEGLRAAGAEVGEEGPLDAVLVAMRGAEPAALATRSPGAVVAQFWGDIDRGALARAGVPFWPVEPPSPGHMGILPSAIGPEPVIRLQAGGLKVGQLLVHGGVDAAVASGFGQAVLP
jgi:hypothetical protein